MKGEIIISKIGRVKITEYEGYKRINTTYRASGIWKQLSPMKLGPFDIIEPLAENTVAIIGGKNIMQPILEYYPDGILPGFQQMKNEKGELIDFQIANCECFEAYWQYCGKIYAHDINKNGIIKKSYYERRAQGLTMSLNSNKPGELRRAYPKAKYGVPVLSYYNGEFMNWVTSRIKVYCPLYAKLVIETDAYKKLKNDYCKGNNIQLLDPDGFDVGLLDNNKISEALHSTKRPFGHGLVLAALLMNNMVWNNLIM